MRKILCHWSNLAKFPLYGFILTLWILMVVLVQLLHFHLLLLLLSHFSCVQLCATPEMAAHQAPPSLGFSRQEHWSGVAISFSNASKWKVKVKSLSPTLCDLMDCSLPGSSIMGFSRQEYWSGVPLPSPTFSSAAAAKSRQLCPALCDPRDDSPPGSPVPGILQARTLEWVAISFSSAWKWKAKVKSLSRVRLFATPWTAAYQAPASMGFSRQKYWSGVPLPSPTFSSSTAILWSSEVDKLIVDNNSKNWDPCDLLAL